jgi:hypothetical protein
MVAQLSVTVKDDHRRLKKDFLIYDAFEMSETDDTIQKCLKETLDEFKGEAEDIKINTVMVLQ